MVGLYTWHDVEKKFQEEKNLWNEDWFRVQVYYDEVVIYGKINDEKITVYTQQLKKIFLKNYDINTNTILVDFTENRLNVYFEEEEERENRNYMPLFKEKYLQNGKDKLQPYFPCKLIAFHSYKGGVGRTLSLVSFLRAFSALYPKKKVLIIDADVEAPGLTWMLEDKCTSDLSYLDILSILKYEKINNDMIERMSEKIMNSVITVKTDQVEVEQYFIPVYHDKKQVLDIDTTSDNIIYSQNNEYIISETIAKLGDKIDADLVLIDLRAGITEFSAPFLFDSRVEKYFVSSTSMQSVKGINQVMEQVYKKTEMGVDNSKIILTTIPSTMEEDKICTIEDSLLTNIDVEIEKDNSTYLKSDFICRIPFDDRLIHIDTFDSLCETLKGREITEKMQKMIGGVFDENKDNNDELNAKFIREKLKKIYEIADSEITAEGNSSANMLVTYSIKELARGFKKSVPKIVIPGAKGSGKTYMYKQLLAAKTWSEFENKANGNADVEGDAVIIPLISTINNTKFKDLIQESILYANEQFHNICLKKSFVNNNFTTLKNFSEEEKTFKQKDWDFEWEKLILSTFNNFKDLQSLDDHLQTEGKKVVFLVDGLEDLFMDMQNQGNNSWKLAFKAICQGLINKLNDLDNGNIGIIVFARKDMINEAIDTNTEQFLSQYRKYELNWTQTEALRLALWLSAKAYPKLGKDIQITSVTKEVIIERLQMLWGKKLGKDGSHEAWSNLWVIAALSDFTGQLQARDIVRFLQNATSSYGSVNLTYFDRLIMPSEIRNAIGPCSQAKLEDIKNEMKSTYSILKKFIEMDESNKKLPLSLDKISLSGDEISKLEAEGYLKIYNKKYYFPEIIRHSLDFSYEKGARPKVLSFLVQQ